MMTNEQRLVLAHVLVNPDTWEAHAIATLGQAVADAAIVAKVARLEPEYLAALAAEGVNYKNRAARDALLPPPPAPETNDQIYDRVIQNEKVLKALALALNDGSFVPGSNKTGPQLKAIIKAKM